MAKHFIDYIFIVNAFRILKSRTLKFVMKLFFKMYLCDKCLALNNALLKNRAIAFSFKGQNI